MREDKVLDTKLVIPQSQEYWNNYYATHDNDRPSLFAQKCLNSYFGDSKRILEFGSGTGRDAFYFQNNGHYVVGVDSSLESVSKLRKKSVGLEDKISFIHGDFCRLNSMQPFQIVYSRFSLHSVDAESASSALRWAYENLEAEGKLCIEVRSIFDELYGQGEEVAPDAFVTDHYRRFIRIAELVNELEQIGFSIVESEESRGFAPYVNEDPIVIRIIAKK